MERSIAEMAAIYINGGRRGFLINIETAELLRVLTPQLVDVALEV
jgi:prolyl-tRNA editing enzyme YbaK/EbsC (Cys-tRNA(Pro) deacylase)